MVRLEPRMLQWDVEANKGPVTCRRRVEARLRGEVPAEAEEETRPAVGLEGEESAEVEEEEEVVTGGEDTSAEVSYSGRAITSDDNPASLSNRSSPSPPPPTPYYYCCCQCARCGGWAVGFIKCIVCFYSTTQSCTAAATHSRTCYTTRLLLSLFHTHLFYHTITVGCCTSASTSLITCYAAPICR